MDAEVVAAEVNAAVAVVGEESISSVDSVRELEDALASPQEEDAILTADSQQYAYHVIGPLDIFSRIEEEHLSF